MNTMTRIGATGASALLTLGLLAAGPAGATDDQATRADREKKAAPVTCVPQEGKARGSTSDPDGMSNGGPDKPGCAGGFDTDRDWNNGCGNDADREDDNNGHCGTTTSSTTPTDTGGADAAPSEDGDSTGSETPDGADDGDESTGSGSEDPDGTDDGDESTGSEDADGTDEGGDSADIASETPASTGEDSNPLTTAGTGLSVLAVLGGLVRLFLRIG